MLIFVIICNYPGCCHMSQRLGWPCTYLLVRIFGDLDIVELFNSTLRT